MPEEARQQDNVVKTGTVTTTSKNANSNVWSGNKKSSSSSKKTKAKKPMLRQKSCLSTQFSFLSEDPVLASETAKEDDGAASHSHLLISSDRYKSSSWPRLAASSSSSSSAALVQRYLLEENTTGTTSFRPLDLCHEGPVGGVFYVWYRSSSSQNGNDPDSCRARWRRSGFAAAARKRSMMGGGRGEKAVIYNAGTGTKLILKSNGGVFYQKYYLEGGWGIVVLLCGVLVHIVNMGLIMSLAVSFAGLVSCTDCGQYHSPHYPTKELVQIGKKTKLAVYIA